MTDKYAIPFAIIASKFKTQYRVQYQFYSYGLNHLDILHQHQTQQQHGVQRLYSSNNFDERILFAWKKKQHRIGRPNLKLNIVEMMMIAANWLEKKMSLASCQYLNSMGVLKDPFWSCKICFLNQKSHNSQAMPPKYRSLCCFCSFFPRSPVQTMATPVCISFALQYT